MFSLFSEHRQRRTGWCMVGFEFQRGLKLPDGFRAFARLMQRHAEMVMRLRLARAGFQQLAKLCDGFGMAAQIETHDCEILQHHGPV